MAVRIEDLLRRAMAVSASDLHITVEAPPVVRVQGRVRPLDDTILKPQDTEEIAFSLLNPDQRLRFKSSGEVSLSYSVSGLGRFRVMVYRQRGSVALSIRLVYPGIPTLGHLGLPEIIGDLALKNRGLVLITGPRGSGKTLVMASMVDHINARRAAHLVTLEDPIEYLHKHKRSIVNQREIGSDTASFADGLKAALRQDPDVLAVGDVPDGETLRLCLESAGASCLVICAMRSAGIESALRALLGMFRSEQRPVIAAQLAECIEGAIGLQIVQSLRQGHPVLLTEILLGTPGVRDIIREERFHHIEAAIKTGVKSGMRTFEQCVEDLKVKGVLTDDEASDLVEKLVTSQTKKNRTIAK